MTNKLKKIAESRGREWDIYKFNCHQFFAGPRIGDARVHVTESQHAEELRQALLTAIDMIEKQGKILQDSFSALEWVVSINLGPDLNEFEALSACRDHSRSMLKMLTREQDQILGDLK